MMTGTNFYEQFEEEAKAEAKAAGKEYKPAEPVSEAPVQTVPAANQTQSAPVQAQPTAPVQPVAPVQPTTPVQPANFDTMSPAGVPTDVTPSAEAKKNIDDFYDSLDED